ncbi:MAG: hypothetical protein JWL62_3851 [Hyphomicrobiales bacterium]|nr:hypothetical protein [Hyphomicrobiales bacterium]
MLKPFAFGVGAMLALGAFSVPANAQDTKRQTLMEKCVAHAQAEYPPTGTLNDPGNSHTWAIYAACMQNLGERP